MRPRHRRWGGQSRGESARVRLEKGESYPLTLVVDLDVYQEPSGLWVSKFWSIAQARFKNVYITAASN